MKLDDILRRESVLDVLLLSLGHREDHSGTQYIRDAVEMYADGTVRMTKDLYPDIGKLHGVPASAVERNIRHSIEWAMDNGDSAAWKKVFGATIPAGDRPTNGAYIARIARLVRLHEN